MIRLDVAYILLTSSIGLFTFETMIMVRNGFLNGKVRQERLGDYEKPVLLAWFSGFLLVPQVTCDILGYVFCDIYSVNIAFLTSAVIFYTLACTDLAFQLSLVLTAARTDRPNCTVGDLRRRHSRLWKFMLFGFLIPTAAGMIISSNIKECHYSDGAAWDHERHYFWGVFELLFAGQMLAPVIFVTGWCYFTGRQLERTLKACPVGQEKAGLARPILMTIKPCIVVNALAFFVVGNMALVQMALLHLAAHDAYYRNLYHLVQCVACTLYVIAMQLFPAFFVSGIVRHCPDVDHHLSRFARQFESSKLTTLINEDGGSTTDALARGRELCCAVRPSQLGPDAFMPGGGLGVTSGGLQKCTHPDFFFSHSWRDSPEEKWAILKQVTEMFEAVHGREPVVWIDKFCIDQTNIDESLLYLPLFASASRAVIVAVGPSYFTRLWCMWEMFVMSHVTYCFDNVIFWPLSGCDVTELSDFRASNVGCFKASDKEKILSVIESLNGGVAQFEKVVQQDVLAAVRKAVGRFEADEADQEALPERKRSQRLSSTGNDDVRNRLSMLEATSSRRLLPAAVDTVRPSLPQTSSPGTNGQPEGRPPDAGTVLRLGSRYGSTELV